VLKPEPILKPHQVEYASFNNPDPAILLSMSEVLLPKAWLTGNVQGLRARGAFEVEVDGKDGRLTGTRVRSLSGGTTQLSYSDSVSEAKLAKGKAFDWNGK